MHVRCAALLRFDHPDAVKMLLPVISHFSQMPNQHISHERIPNGLKLIHGQVCLSCERRHEGMVDTASIDDPLDINGQPLLALSRLSRGHETPRFPLP